jgi:UDP-glucose 4-epimerase
VLYAAADEARRALGWTPRFGDLDTIVRTAWDWHRAHPQGYDGK